MYVRATFIYRDGDFMIANAKSAQNKALTFREGKCIFYLFLVRKFLFNNAFFKDDIRIHSAFARGNHGVSFLRSFIESKAF